MAGPDMGRLRKEMVECAKDWETSGVAAAPVADAMTHLRGRIRGPQDSPYEGGVFEVDILIGRGYPFEPPKMKFMTQIWHPNVSSQTGAICLDILKDQWSPALTIKTALLSLQALLSTPEPNDPQDAQVASQYKKDYKGWCKSARFWTESYAMGPEAAAKAAAAAGGKPAAPGTSEAGAASPAAAGAAKPAASSVSNGGSSSSSSGAAARSTASAPAPAPAVAVAAAEKLDPRLQQLVDMGFEKSRAVAALKLQNGNVAAAVEYLFGTS